MVKTVPERRPRAPEIDRRQARLPVVGVDDVVGIGLRALPIDRGGDQQREAHARCRRKSAPLSL